MNATRILPALLLAASLLLTGCEDDPRDRRPPEGQGSLLVINNTVNNLAVFIDGERVGGVDGFKDRAFDRDPGLYRIILDERDGDRSFRDDLDVLVGRVTVIEVFEDPSNFSRFDTAVYFRNP
jgi:hypothetical protein